MTDEFEPKPRVSDRSRTVTALLCVLIGFVGAHRFYCGKTVSGILYVFTLGGLGVGVFFDLLMIITGHFTDREGNKVLNWG